MALLCSYSYTKGTWLASVEATFRYRHFHLLFFLLFLPGPAVRWLTTRSRVMTRSGNMRVSSRTKALAGASFCQGTTNTANATGASKRRKIAQWPQLVDRFS